MAGRTLRVVTLVAICFGLGAVVPVPVGAAPKPVINGTGAVSCSGTAGTIKFVPPLSSTTRATKTTVKMTKLTCTGATGNAAVTVTGAKIKGTSTNTSGLSCADIAPRPGGVPFGSNATQDPMVLDLKWKAQGGKINPTRITAPSWAFWSNTYIVLAGTAAPPPPVTVSGSYAGMYATSGAGSPLNDATLAATCAGTKGLKKVPLNQASVTIFVLS